MKQLHIIISIVLIFIISLSVNAQNINVGEQTQLSLLTCSPGPAGYEKFGHTAIRIYDPSQGVDLVANWGLFDFEKPDFYYNFVKGETYYLLGVHPTAYFLVSYQERNSSVTEQVLNLDDVEKQQLVDKIMTNYRPENREYLYNFVFDNCATRPRDMILELFDEAVSFESSYEAKSFRQWVGQYAGEQSWMMFGIDLVFGKDADALASRFEAMFLPEVLEQQFARAVVNKAGTSYPLVTKNHQIVRKVEKESRSLLWLVQPFIIFFFLLILGGFFSYLEIAKRKRFRLFDFILFFIAGVAGLIILYLMFFSIHPLVHANYNLIWLSPISLIVAFALLGKKGRVWKTWLLIFMLICTVLALVLAIVGPQVINIAFVPLMSLLIVRLLANLLTLRIGAKENK